MSLMGMLFFKDERVCMDHISVDDGKRRENVLKGRIENSRYELTTAVHNLTIYELGEILGFIDGSDVGVFKEPFPHITLSTSYGEMTFFDTEKGWLEHKIEIDTFSIRCVFADGLKLSPESMLAFNERCKENDILLRDGDRYIFQASLRIMPKDNVLRLLERLLDMSDRCEELSRS
jgi:hypothetical protein